MRAALAGLLLFFFALESVRTWESLDSEDATMLSLAGSGIDDDSSSSESIESMEDAVDSSNDKQQSRGDNFDDRHVGGYGSMTAIARARDDEARRRQESEARAVREFEKAEEAAIRESREQERQRMIRRRQMEEEAARRAAMQAEAEKRRAFEANKKYWAAKRKAEEEYRKKVSERDAEISRRQRENHRGVEIRVKVHKKTDRIVIPFRGVLFKRPSFMQPNIPFNRIPGLEKAAKRRRRISKRRAKQTNNRSRRK